MPPLLEQIGMYGNYIDDFYCSIHGIGIRFTVNSTAVAEIIREDMFSFLKDLEISYDIHVNISMVSHIEALPKLIPPTATQVGTLKSRPNRVISKYVDDCCLYTYFSEGAFIATNCETGMIQGSLVSNDWLRLDFLKEIYCDIFRIMASKQFYLIHAAAVCKSGKGLLFIANAGGGKTTTAGGMVSQYGFQLLADDWTILTKQNGNIQLLGFPNSVGLRIEIIEFFRQSLPVTQYCKQNLPPESKIRIQAQQLYPDAIAHFATPAAVIFLSHCNAECSINSIAKLDAIVRLSQATVRFLNPLVQKEYFLLITQLIDTVPAFTLNLGTNVKTTWATLATFIRTHNIVNME